MKPFFLASLTIGASCAPVAFAAQTAAPAAPAAHYLRQISAFDLPGPGGKRFDYLTIDPDDGYLLSAHLGAGQTYVISLSTHEVVATVRDTPGADTPRRAICSSSTTTTCAASMTAGDSTRTSCSSSCSIRSDTERAVDPATRRSSPRAIGSQDLPA
jgi:hypothetical protein